MVPISSSSGLSSSSLPPESGDTYTVQHGDTLGGIAAAHGVSLEALQQANPQIHNPDVIYPGDHVNIPHTTSNEARQANPHVRHPPDDPGVPSPSLPTPPQPRIPPPSDDASGGIRV